ncbi:unnamed protein product [Moneuplotes crassus]|uniref:Uncharacterized protein n=1 Tax=Euplotes crassus TaxID=5936 RepID=A0AAD1Y6Z9_EUPCR|nr:unnamed protein product [Moneuplotes crassus]
MGIKDIKLNVRDCISGGALRRALICLYCKGVLIEPFKCKKCDRFYCKKCMDLVLKNTNKSDPTKGCIWNKIVECIDVDESVKSKKVKCRSTEFVYATKEFLKELNSLKFMCGICPTINPKVQSKCYPYKLYIKHLLGHSSQIKKRLEKLPSRNGQTSVSFVLDGVDSLALVDPLALVSIKEEGNSDSEATNDTSHKSKKTKNTSGKKRTRAGGKRGPQNPYFSTTNLCKWCGDKIPRPEQEKHIALNCIQLREKCYYCLGYYPRAGMNEHLKTCLESYEECPDCEFLMKRGQNMQSHYCRRKEFDNQSAQLKLENIRDAKIELQTTYEELRQALDHLNGMTNLADTKLEDTKEEFLMKFDRKELLMLIEPITEKYDQLAEGSDEEKVDEGQGIYEHAVEYREDQIREIIPYLPKDDPYCEEKSRDTLIIQRNSSSILVWHMKTQKIMFKIEICKITERDSQVYFVDKCTIISTDILVLCCHNKKETSILFYKIPTLEDLETLGVEFVEYQLFDNLGSFQCEGRVTILKDSFFSSETFYLFSEHNDMHYLRILQIEEKIKEDSNVPIQITCEIVFQIEFSDNIQDLLEIPNGDLRFHLSILTGKDYEIYKIGVDQFGDIDFKSIKQVTGTYGILLPPKTIEYFHRMLVFDHDLLLFISNDRLEFRRIYVEKTKTSEHYYDEVYCGTSLPIDCPCDREALTQMEQIYGALELFHKGRGALYEWQIGSNKKLVCNVLWENKSSRTFTYSFYDNNSRQACMVDLNNDIVFLKFADVKTEV